jgi:hypothetical protein
LVGQAPLDTADDDSELDDEDDGDTDEESENSLPDTPIEPELPSEKSITEKVKEIEPPRKRSREEFSNQMVNRCRELVYAELAMADRPLTISRIVDILNFERELVAVALDHEWFKKDGAAYAIV